jgi:hypothetical protein
MANIFDVLKLMGKRNQNIVCTGLSGIKQIDIDEKRKCGWLKVCIDINHARQITVGEDGKIPLLLVITANREQFEAIEKELDDANRPPASDGNNAGNLPE